MLSARVESQRAQYLKASLISQKVFCDTLLSENEVLPLTYWLQQTQTKTQERVSPNTRRKWENNPKFIIDCTHTSDSRREDYP